MYERPQPVLVHTILQYSYQLIPGQNKKLHIKKEKKNSLNVYLPFPGTRPS